MSFLPQKFDFVNFGYLTHEPTNLERILKINIQKLKKGWDVISVANPYKITGSFYGILPLGTSDDEEELEDRKYDLSKTDEEIRKLMIGANKMPSVQ